MGCCFSKNDDKNNFSFNINNKITNSFNYSKNNFEHNNEYSGNNFVFTSKHNNINDGNLIIINRNNDYNDYSSNSSFSSFSKSKFLNSSFSSSNKNFFNNNNQNFDFNNNYNDDNSFNSYNSLRINDNIINYQNGFDNRSINSDSYIPISRPPITPLQNPINNSINYSQNSNSIKLKPATPIQPINLINIGNKVGLPPRSIAPVKANGNIAPIKAAPIAPPKVVPIQNNTNINLSIKEAFLFLVHGCRISPDILDNHGTTQTGWKVGRKNGPPGYLKDYYPPIGWTAIGLKVANLYDNGDNEWLNNNNSKGEWYIGYHGVKTIEAIQGICYDGFRRGDGQRYKDSHNINPLNNFSYPICGEGVYFTNEINVANQYTMPITYNGNNYRIVFMCRINPYKVRIADIGNKKEYWIVDGDKLGDLFGHKRSDEVRPYRVLVLKQP